jgi:hypothetical protein
LAEPTFIQSRALSLLAFEPLWVGTNLVTDALGFTIDSLQVTQAAFGGYWTLRFNLADRQSKIEDWIEGGLGRHIELYNPALELIWEGFVNQIRGNIGGLSVSRGPHLGIGNRMRTVFSTVDTSVTPPAMGVRASTDLADDTDSQAKYGIIERTISVGGVSEANAEQIRDTALDELKEPETSETDNLSSSRSANVTVECLGYFHWLKAYTYSSTTTGTEDADTKIQNVLTADPNGIFSTDYNDIIANTTAVGAYEQDNRTAMTIIKGIVGLGDSSFNRYLFGFYKDRKARYAAIPTDTEYQRSLLEPEQKLARYATGQRVLPWDAQAGEWVFYTDLLIGRSQPSERRLDPRYLFIEQASYSLPWALSLQGSRSGRLDQLLARLGLGGTSA